MTATGRASVVVVPLFRRHLLWHLIPPTGSKTPPPPPPSWRGGATLRDKAARARAQVAAYAKGKLAATWASLEAAPDGSIKFWMYRGAQAVLAREHPDAAFLRAVAATRAPPATPNAPAPPALHITHAASAPLRYVRRRARLLAAAEAGLRRKGHAWTAATVALLPLFLLPLPAFPVYFCAWKAWSARTAARGAAALGADLEAADRAAAAAAACFPTLSTQPLPTPAYDVVTQSRYYAYFRGAAPWPVAFTAGGGGGAAAAAVGAAAVRAAPIYLDALARDAAALTDVPVPPGVEKETDGDVAISSTSGTPPCYSASPLIDAIADPPARAAGSPLSPAAAAALAERLPAAGLEAAAARARRRWVGAEFPAGDAPVPT